MDTTAETRRNRGAMSYHAGLSAEERISTDYERRGFTIAQRRWRGKRGEIDLIAHDGDGLVFVEVKQSSDFDRTVARVSPRQMKRLYASAEGIFGQNSQWVPYGCSV